MASSGGRPKPSDNDGYASRFCIGIGFGEKTVVDERNRNDPFADAQFGDQVAFFPRKRPAAQYQQVHRFVEAGVAESLQKPREILVPATSTDMEDVIPANVATQLFGGFGRTRKAGETVMDNQVLAGSTSYK